MSVTVVLIVYLVALTVGSIIGVVVGIKEPVVDQYRSVLTTEEYNTFMMQSQQAASVAHGGDKLFPDKTLFEVITDGAKESKLVFPNIDF